MKTKLSSRSRLGAVTVAFLTAVAMLATNAQPANASVLDPLKKAYEWYIKYVQGQVVAVTATEQIIIQINVAKIEIMAHIDLVAAADVQACAEAAVIEFEDIEAMSPTVRENFAMSATACVTRAKNLLSSPATNIAAVDILGFVMNAVGPIALMARARAGYSTSALRTAIEAGNNTLIPKLTPMPGTPVPPAGHCFASANTGDQEPGELLEYIIRCTSYNGDTGFDSCWGCIVYTNAQRQAVRNTSRPVAIAVNAVL
jgi:hypothetical protein